MKEEQGGVLYFKIRYSSKYCFEDALSESINAGKALWAVWLGSVESQEKIYVHNLRRLRLRPRSKG